MSRRGRKPLPPGLKLLKGERADRMPAVASPAAAPPECPAWLDDVAREEWGRMASMLGPGPGGPRRLAIYCDAFSRLQLAREEIRAHGVTLFTDSGGLKGNPAVGVAAVAHATMLRVLEELERDVPAAEPEEDELTKFLANRPYRRTDP